MSIGKGLHEIADRIEASMTIALNEHKAVYEDAETYYMVNTSVPANTVGEIDFGKDIWELQVYPDTPIGFYRAISNDLKALVNWGLEVTQYKERP